MSTPLTDRINLLTSQANAVTGASDTTLSDAVNTLIEGYGGGSSDDLFPYIKSVASKMFDQITFPKGYELLFKNLISINNVGFLENAIATDELTLTFKQKPTKLGQALYRLKRTGSTLKVNFNCDTSQCTTFYNFANGSQITEIVGEFDFSSATNITALFYGCNDLREIRLKKSTLSMPAISGVFSSCPFSDESLVSIANGLNPAESQDIYLKPIAKTRCEVIMGNNDNGIFVADETGAMTLADFIANVKGWTLA